MEIYDSTIINALKKLTIWEDIYNLSQDMALPWLVGGNFDVMLSDEEKIGGLPICPQEYVDFSFCINSCDLLDISFKEFPITW